MTRWSAILLSGGPADHGMSAVLGIPLDDLPLCDDCTVSEAWIRVLDEDLANDRIGTAPRHHLRILAAGDPRATASPDASPWNEVVEPRSPRGVAGVISDVMRSWEPADDLGDWLLVIESSASPCIDVAALFQAAERSPDVCLIFGVSHLDRPCGVYLVRRDIYDLVPETGFFDFKEQLIARMVAEGLRIEAVVVAERAIRLDTRQGWLANVDRWAGSNLHQPIPRADGARAWARREGSSVVHPGSVVDGAVIISSVVMDEAVIEPGATVARSIVGPGVKVPSGAVLVDAVFTQESRTGVATGTSEAEGQANDLERGTSR